MANPGPGFRHDGPSPRLEHVCCRRRRAHALRQRVGPNREGGLLTGDYAGAGPGWQAGEGHFLARNRGHLAQCGVRQ